MMSGGILNNDFHLTVGCCGGGERYLGELSFANVSNC
ncbi:hypothetical protein PEC106664_40490 [Pectobacterium carotovorum subsp. carotovorum]|nr:hypothetical protein PEC106664_40490 [Pectobacterium carotovorum subsp. carotovorum]